MDCIRIAKLARELVPYYAPVEAAYQALVNDPAVNDTVAWEAAIKAYNEAFRARIHIIAACTPNSESSLLQVLLPAGPYDTFPDPQYMMNVANYESFHHRLWTKNSGFERAPTHEFTF
jgi:hypothetical protein